MKFFKRGPDGGEGSGVTALYLVEIKSLFTVAILRFEGESRRAYHNHAFNALTLWLRGRVVEELRDGDINYFRPGNVKYTPRTCFHKVHVHGTPVWALSFRGPWSKTWQEDREGSVVTLTHGRVVLDNTPTTVV